jgi:Ser/Thr protein kinase RdoA (MazF antagonist)
MADLAIAHSVPKIASISSFVAEAYDVGYVRECRFLCRGLNDTYGLVSDAGRHVLRCYRAGWRTTEDIAYEIEALLHLAGKNVPAALPVARRDGSYVDYVDFPEGCRALVMFTHADGRLRETAADSYRYGEALARIHTATDDFISSAQRFPLNLDYLLGDPLAALLPLLAHRPDDREYLLQLAYRLRQECEIAAVQLSRGFCHGDAWGENAHLTPAAVTFFDFDCCGSGWRSDDLAVFFYGQLLLDRPDRSTHCAALLDGYQARRSIAGPDLEAIPLFVLLRQIWHMGLHAAGSENWGSGWINDAYLDSRLENLRRWDESRLRELLPAGAQRSSRGTDGRSTA